jgi:hypothetical protein
VLTVLCVSLALHRAALGEVARTGMTGKSADGQSFANRMVRVVARQTELILRPSDRLGLSPSARAGLEMPEQGSRLASGRRDHHVKAKAAVHHRIVGSSPDSDHPERAVALSLKDGEQSPPGVRELCCA